MREGVREGRVSEGRNKRVEWRTREGRVAGKGIGRKEYREEKGGEERKEGESETRKTVRVI